MHAAGAAHQDVACESGSSAYSASDECYSALVDLVQLAARAALCDAPWGTSVGLACRETRLAGAVGVRSGGAPVTTGSDQAHLEREMVTSARLVRSANSFLSMLSKGSQKMLFLVASCVVHRPEIAADPYVSAPN